MFNSCSYYSDKQSAEFLLLTEITIKANWLFLSTGMMDKRMDVEKHSINMPSASRHPIHKDPSPIDRNPYMEKVSELLRLKRQCPVSLLLPSAQCFL